jgi:hypothetical protein
MAITLNKNGIGYFHGDEVKAVTYCRHDNLVRFVYLEGMDKDKELFQPAETVLISEKP